jgi:hypothetical protein
VIVATAVEGIEMEELWMKLEAEMAAEAAKKNEALTKESRRSFPPRDVMQWFGAGGGRGPSRAQDHRWHATF